MPATRHCVMVGLMGVGKSTVGAAVATRLGWAFHDSDADIQAATGLTVDELRDRDGVDAMHAREADQLLDALAAPEPVGHRGGRERRGRAGACLEALGAGDVFVVWLRAEPELLAERFESATIIGRPTATRRRTFLARQLAARGAAFASVADLVGGRRRARPPEEIADRGGGGAPASIEPMAARPR